MRQAITRMLSTATAGLAVMAAAACAPERPPASDGNGTTAAAPEQLRVEVLEELPHDPEAFTQGLEVVDDTLYEGTGLVGESTLRAGPVGGEPDTTVALPEPLFGEGITVVGSRVWQLTWRDGVAIERDRDTLAERRRVSYEGEGWGLCHQSSGAAQGESGAGRLVMSDGTATLTFRDPGDFTVLDTVEVTDGGTPVSDLNELECAGGDVYANVWHSDRILRIDPGSGTVTAHIDASGLLSPEEAAEADVLNGIAKLAGSDRFLLTGKLWPKMFTVRFVPTGS